MTTNSGADMNIMTNTLERKPARRQHRRYRRKHGGRLHLDARAPAFPHRHARYDDAMRPLGITASQFTLLTQLAAQDGITAVEIGHALDIEKSTLSRNLKRLLALGHITMDPPAGRRGRGLHLTPKGEAVLKDAFPVWQDAQKRAFTVMGAESRNTLDGLLMQAEKLAAA